MIIKVADDLPPGNESIFGIRLGKQIRVVLDLQRTLLF